MAIDIQGEQMVQQVVARGNASEHATHPGRRLLIGFRARRGGA
jgi:hypothetical protein